MSPTAGGLWDDIIPRVDAERCRRCTDCPAVAACMSSSIRRDGLDGVPVIDDRICFGCYSCAGACPYKAIIVPRSR